MEERKEVVTRSIVFGILLIILGVLAIVFRQPIVDAITTFMKWVIGGILIVAGIINIIFFVKDRSRVPQLIIGILAIAAGICMFFFNLIVWIIAVFLGVTLLLDGVFKVKESFAANKAKAKAWYVSLILGVLNIILGVLALVSPLRFGNVLSVAFLIIIAIVLIVTGIQDVVHGVLISGAK